MLHWCQEWDGTRSEAGSDEEQLPELLHQQQLKMEGHLKELPQEESWEQADDVSEQRPGAEETSDGQLSEYPQCSLENISRYGHGQLADNGLDECTGEEQSWIKLLARLICPG